MRVSKGAWITIGVLIVAGALFCLCFGPKSVVFLGRGMTLWMSNAEADATSAKLAGDARLLGIYGFALTVPAVDGDAEYRMRLIDLHGVRPLDGTSDEIQGPIQNWFQDKAIEYAYRYNRRILEAEKTR